MCTPRHCIRYSASAVAATLTSTVKHPHRCHHRDNHDPCGATLGPRWANCGPSSNQTAGTRARVQLCFHVARCVNDKTFARGCVPVSSVCRTNETARSMQGGHGHTCITTCRTNATGSCPGKVIMTSCFFLRIVTRSIDRSYSLGQKDCLHALAVTRLNSTVLQSKAV